MSLCFADSTGVTSAQIPINVSTERKKKKMKEHSAVAHVKNFYYLTHTLKKREREREREKERKVTQFFVFFFSVKYSL